MNDLQSLIMRGMKGFFSADCAEILRDIAEGVASLRYKMFISENSAFCILQMPKTPFEFPQVLHFYSEKPSLTNPLVSKVLDFVKNSGYNKLIAINGSGIPDEVWTRLFHHKDWKIKPTKTVFEFEVIQ